MTTIVATTHAIYADSNAGAHIPFPTSKLAYVTDKDGAEYLTGGAGYMEELILLQKMLAEHGLHNLWRLHTRENAIPKLLKGGDTDMIVITREREIYLLSNMLVPMPVHAPVYAVGTGAEYALSALAFGKSPVEAIEFACERDPWSKAPVHELHFRRKRRVAD